MEAVVDRTRAIKSSSFEVHIITAVDREITTSVVVALSLRLAQGRHHTAAVPFRMCLVYMLLNPAPGIRYAGRATHPRHGRKEHFDQQNYELSFSF